MKIFTQGLKTNSIFIIAACIAVLLLSNTYSAKAQTMGIYESYVILNLNGGGNTYYDLAAATGNPDFQGANLGVFGQAQTLVLAGGQNKTFKCDGGDVTGGHIFYRVYPFSSAGGAFNSSSSFSWISNESGGCGGNQTWVVSNNTTDIKAGLAAGIYNLEVYTEATGSPGTAYSSNGGNNFIASFTVTDVPIAYNVTGTASYCQGGSGVAVGLSGSQSGVDYTLIKEGTPTATVIAGTGSAITFGLQLNGTYTASAAADGSVPTIFGSNKMNENAVITETPLSTVDVSISACDSYTWALNGVTYTTSGNYSYVVGCVTNILHLTITPSSTVETTASACDSYTWALNGVNYTTGGDKTFVAGCVTNTLHLTITPSSTVNVTASACDSYTWALNGVTYSSSGNYTFVIGCVTNILHLTITPSSTVNATASACDFYTWALNGVTYFTSGDYTYVAGCVTNILHLTITPSVIPTFTQSGPYCIGATPDALPTASTNSITGSWSPATISTAAAGSITYHFTPTAGQCATTATMVVFVNGAPTANAGTGGVITANVPYTLSTATATDYTSVSWAKTSGIGTGGFNDPTSLNPIFTGTSDGPITLTLTAYGCNSATTTSNVTLYIVSGNPVIWLGATNNDWNTPSNWLPAFVPTAAYDVLIPNGPANHPSISVAAACNNINIESGTSILGNELLTVHGIASVNITMSAGYYHSFSPSVTGAYANMFYTPVAAVYLYSHSEAANATASGYTQVSGGATALSAMTGYAVYPYSPATTFTENGTDLNKGNYSKALTTTGAGAFAGFNYVGNPYPSAIDWNASGWTKTIVDNAIYIEHNAGWDAYVNGIGTGPAPGGSNLIALGQGFFVHANVAGTLAMTPSVRLHSGVPYLKSKTAASNFIRLVVSGNGYSDDAVVRFSPEATAQFDGDYDAYKLYGSVDQSAQIYTLGSVPLAINSLPETDKVAVGIKVGASGTYTIAATEINDLNYVTLEDTQTGILTPLSSGSYTFTADAGSFDQRFKLLFSMTSIQDSRKESAIVYSYQRTVHINMKDQQKGDVFIYTITGQLVKTIHSAVGTNEIMLPVSGNYVVKVVGKNGITVRKVWIQ